MYYSHFASTLGDPDRRQAPPPELTLATAVIEQAVADLSGPLDLARPAALWLMSDSLEEYSSRSLCDMLGIEHSRLVTHTEKTWWRYQSTDWREAPTDKRGHVRRAFTREQFVEFRDRGMTRLDVIAETGVVSREITSCSENYRIKLRPYNDGTDAPEATWRKLEPLLRRLVGDRQPIRKIAAAIGMQHVPAEVVLERMQFLGIHVPYKQQSAETTLLRETYRLTGSIQSAARATGMSSKCAEERLRNVQPAPQPLRLEDVTLELLQKWQAFQLSSERVAAIFGLRFIDIRKAEQRLGVELPPKRYRAWHLIEDQMRADIDAGKTFDDLVSEYEIPITSHKRLRHRLLGKGARR